MKYIISTKYDGRSRKCFLKKCKHCKCSFYVPKHRLKTAKFCSKSCSSTFRQSKRKLLCAKCKKEFFRNPSSLKNSKSGLYFCSRTCKDLAQRIDGIKDIHPSHYGKDILDYRLKVFRSREYKCEKCGLINWLGEDIVLDVHHKDGNRKNNANNNLLIVCPNCHRQLEMKKRNK